MSERRMSEPSRMTERFEREMEVLAGIWLQQHQQHCDWCRAPFKHFTDLRSYLEFCRSLGKLWPTTSKTLPAPRVFCESCAPGAIGELIDGTRFVVGNSAGSDPWERSGVAR